MYEKPKLLFGDWLSETDKLQREAFNNELMAMDPEARASEFRTQAFSAVTEIVEMSNEIGWKPWATSRHLDRGRYLKEGVDVLHFLANLLLLAGITDEELNKAYREKMQVNRRRQLAGYSGTEKCPNCKRAWDDIRADLNVPEECLVSEEVDGLRLCLICINDINEEKEITL